MLLFDELAASLQDLPSDRYGAITRALSRLGIHVSKDPIKSNTDSGLHLSIRVDFVDLDDVKLPQEAKFQESTRRWQLTSAPPLVRGTKEAKHLDNRPKTGKNGGPSLDEEVITPTERLTHESTTSSNDHNHKEEAVPSDYVPDWLDQLPQSAHLDFIRSRDWAATEVGPIEQWPFPLRLMFRKMLADPRAANLYWGKGRVAIYNEQFVTLAQNRHPFMMGATAEAAMPLTWSFLQPMFDEVERSGIAFSMPEVEMTVEKNGGFVEEAWYDAVFSPVFDDKRQLLGLYNSGFEITAPKMLQRRSQLLHKLGATPNLQHTNVWSHITETCEPFERDVPLVIVYSACSVETPHLSRCSLRLEACLGIDRSHPSIPAELELHETKTDSLRVAKSSGKPVILGKPGSLPIPDIMNEGIQWRGHGKPSTHIAVIPIFTTGMIAGFVIVGLNPLRPFDEEHEQFTNDLSRVLTTLLDSSVSIEQAKAREAQLTKELTERERYTAAMTENVSVGIYNISATGSLTWGNSKLWEITGLSSDPADASDLSFIECFHVDDRQKGLEAFERVSTVYLPESGELRLNPEWTPSKSFAEEEERWVLYSHSAHMVNGKFGGVIGCITDISHVKRVEKLQKSVAEAAVTARLQQESFIDLTSHELRNPLSAVIQCADDICTLAEQARRSCSIPIELLESIESMVESARTILLCSAHSQNIINDVLTFSKLGSSLLGMTAVPISPVDIARLVIDMFKNEAIANNIDLGFACNKSFEDLPEVVHGDPTRITQIVVNLLTNALKFTKTSKNEKSIELRLGFSVDHPPTNIGHVEWFPSGVERTDSIKLTGLGTGEIVYLVMSVKDTGKGMTKEDMSKLFKRFSQTDRLTHIEYGGSGLGLYLAREITELHGGQIGCTSTSGQGSTFTFYIKCAKASATEIANFFDSTSRRRSSTPRLTPQPSRSRLVVDTLMPAIPGSPAESKFDILLVEDNLINQKVLSKQLRRSGCTVHVANQGVEALDFIKTSRYWRDNGGNGHEISFILLDVEMPVMGGIECAQHIREHEKNGLLTKHLTIIATTANAREEQVQMAYDAGMDHFLAKPFKVADVMKLAAK